MRALIKLIKLLRGFLEREKELAEWRGYYAGSDTPKTLGSKIRRY
jgi:hypothetical protein